MSDGKVRQRAPGILIRIKSIRGEVSSRTPLPRAIQCLRKPCRLQRLSGTNACQPILVERKPVHDLQYPHRVLFPFEPLLQGEEGTEAARQRVSPLSQPQP